MVATIRIGDMYHLAKSQKVGNTGKTFADVVKKTDLAFDPTISLLKKSLLEDGETENREWMSVGMLGEA